MAVYFLYGEEDFNIEADITLLDNYTLDDIDGDIGNSNLSIESDITLLDDCLLNGDPDDLEI